MVQIQEILANAHPCDSVIQLGKSLSLESIGSTYKIRRSSVAKEDIVTSISIQYNSCIQFFAAPSSASD